MCQGWSRWGAMDVPAGRVLRVRIHCLFGESCILAACQQLLKAYVGSWLTPYIPPISTGPSLSTSWIWNWRIISRYRRSSRECLPRMNSIYALGRPGTCIPETSRTLSQWSWGVAPCLTYPGQHGMNKGVRLYGTIGGVKMIFRLLTGSWRFNSSDSLFTILYLTC